MKATTINIVRPEEILSEELQRGIKHLLPELKKASDIDDANRTECDRFCVARATEEADALFDRSIKGDTKAEETLWQCGGRAGYLARAQDRFSARNTARETFVFGQGDLIEKYSAAVRPAADKALARIVEQHNAVQVALGEPIGPNREWSHRIEVLKRDLPRRDIALPGYGSPRLREVFGFAGI